MQALVEAHKKKTGHTLRLNHSQLLGGDILNITATQRNKITKAKVGGRNIELKLSKTQIAKNGGALSAILARFMPRLTMRLSPKILGTLGLAAASGGIQKAVMGSGTTKTGGFGPEVVHGPRRENPLRKSAYLKSIAHHVNNNPHALWHASPDGSGTTNTGGFGPLGGLILGSVLTPLIGKLFGGGQGKGLRLPGTDWGTGLRSPGIGGKRKKERAKV